MEDVGWRESLDRNLEGPSIVGYLDLTERDKSSSFDGLKFRTSVGWEIKMTTFAAYHKIHAQTGTNKEFSHSYYITNPILAKYYM
jgi:hypothetical protein